MSQHQRATDKQRHKQLCLQSQPMKSGDLFHISDASLTSLIPISVLLSIHNMIEVTFYLSDLYTKTSSLRILNILQVPQNMKTDKFTKFYLSNKLKKNLKSYNTNFSSHIHQSTFKLIKHDSWKCMHLFGRHLLNLFSKRKSKPEGSHYWTFYTWWQFSFYKGVLLVQTVMTICS